MPRRPVTRQKFAPGEQLWLVTGEGELRTDRVAEVAPRLRTFQTLSYAVPEPQQAVAQPGCRVRIPYGAAGRVIEGWVLRVSQERWGHTRKTLLSVEPGDLILNPTLIELARWIASYYHCPLGLVLDGFVPARLRSATCRPTAWVRLHDPAAHPLNRRQQRIVDTLATGERPLKKLLAATETSRATLARLRERGVIEIELRCASAADEPGVAESGPPDVPGPTRETEAERLPASGEDQYALTPSQTAALNALQETDARGFGVHVLFGVPGSGKTEVYVRAMRRVIAAGRQALLLVPEIALATQIVARLARRFGRVAVLHSRLTAAARAHALRQIAAGGFDVVIGTRTAVFAPLRRLGLIVVDEEQEGSFKNLAAPFYHTRDVAIKRAQLENIPVALGSATPSLETWHNLGDRPHYHKLHLPERVPGAELPRVELIDTGRRELGQTTTLLSPELLARLREAIFAGHQAILLHNRRGYAAMLRCQRCGLMLRCDRCGTHLIYHRSGDETKCHRCGRRGPAPRSCPDNTCNGELERYGLGIQKLEDELAAQLPAARLLRLDRDTMRKRGDYAVALEAFERREADILIGTQMVAKGLDFPGVRLVGVLDADAGMALPDPRAFERTFQLLMQVVGRAGRQAGESLALIQTAQPELPLFQQALSLDYPAFAQLELPVRKAAGDPPYRRLTRILCLDPRGASARAAAERIAVGLRDLASKISAAVRVDDPQPAPLARLRELHRWQVLLRTPSHSPVATRLLQEAETARLLRPRIARITIDVDPIDLM